VDRRDAPCYINGKFLGRRTTGTERFARGIVGALDALLPVRADWTLLCPPGARPPTLTRIRVRSIGPAGLPPHLWEQVVLPWAARDGLLLNLGGSAPYAGRHQVNTIHDAAVFDHPQAYTRAFVAWYRLLFRRQAARGHRLLTVSTFSRDRLASALEVPPSRFTFVPNGSDHLASQPADPGAIDRLGLRGTTCLLAVASDNPTKNLARLIEAYGRLPPDPARRLVLVGGGNARVFADGATPADLPGVVRTGPIDDATLTALYRHARALVFPSLYEGFGLPAVEAMATGCAVIAASAGALPEVCGEAACYVDPMSTPSITDAMSRVLEDDALHTRLVEAGRARAATFTWRESAARLLDALASPE
jgi:glycosyltransferase involved in cell wall biosynthesis